MHLKRSNLSLVVLFLLLLLALPAAAIQEIDPDQAPNLALTTYQGEALTLADFAGQPLIVHFWATWSEPSTGDTLVLQQLWQRYDGRVAILGINHFDPDEAARAFIAEQQLSYLLVPDPAGQAAIAFGIRAIPKTFLISPEGRIEQTLEEPLTLAPLDAWLAAYIEAPEIVEPDSSIEALIPPYALRRYADLPQSRTSSGFPVLGSPDAPVVLEDFSSFACPFCQNYHESVFAALLEYVRAGDLRIIYVPIWSSGPLPNSLNANHAALCAADQDAFWPYHDILFDWHKRYADSAFDDARLRAGAVQIGLNMAEWDDCLNSQRLEAVLDAATAEFRSRGFRGTPTIVINGQPVRATQGAIEDAMRQILGDQT